MLGQLVDGRGAQQAADARDAPVAAVDGEAGSLRLGAAFGLALASPFLAAAMGPQARLHSYDPQTKLGVAGPDAPLAALLDRYGLSGRVELHVADSHAVEPPGGEFGLVLVDGDPTYVGSRLDYERFCLRLRPGGHALFHDAVPPGPRHEALGPLLLEVEREGELDRQPNVGTFAHFTRRGG